eukprot:UN08496
MIWKNLLLDYVKVHNAGDALEVVEFPKLFCLVHQIVYAAGFRQFGTICYSVYDSKYILYKRKLLTILHKEPFFKARCRISQQNVAKDFFRAYAHYQVKRFTEEYRIQVLRLLKKTPFYCKNDAFGDEKHILQELTKNTDLLAKSGICMSFKITREDRLDARF